MIVLCGEDVETVACSICRVILSYLKCIRRYRRERLPLKALYMLHRDFPKERIKCEIVSKVLREETKDIELTVADYSETEEFLGTTFDILVMDLTDDLKPNDLGRLIGIVRGGGIIILNPPGWSSWENKLTLFQKELATPQHPESEVRNIFIRWVKRKLIEHNGIFIYDVSKRRTIKIPKEVEVEKREKREIKIPENTVFPRKLYELALTNDQVNVIKILEEFIERPKGERKKILVLTADRGRGKSCALGIGIAGLINELRKVKHRVRVLVTAPSIVNVQSFMELAVKSLETLGLKPKPIRKRGRIIEIQGEKYSIEYWDPLDIVSMKADIVVVDEAAGLQVPMLHKIWNKHKRILFSSTIHGYEGAGRGFSVRFLKAIREDKRTEIVEYEMEEPIRYSENDPIEKWQFDTLLLDAEPAELSKEDIEAIARGEFIYVKPDLEEWFSDRGENELKQFFGIYVLAHYRNQPDDLGMMADAPHHTIRALKLKTGKIVCSVQLAEEGPIPEDMVDNLLLGGRIPGNIIPDRFLKHIRIRDFSKTVGWRIVRIATHPQVMGRGIGS
ncbi:MAG TPA: tRNA(Met) cytidine acetyltransferase, partial [Desulfurococcales archaeon]|nr:tRNA(Met) cytidine acetyltransferase [Desulfurococcales archaeon]